MKKTILKYTAFAAIAVAAVACSQNKGSELHDKLVKEHHELEQTDSLMEAEQTKLEDEHAAMVKKEAGEKPAKNEQDHKMMESQHASLIAKMDSISRLHHDLTTKHETLEEEHLAGKTDEAKLKADHEQMMKDHEKMKTDHAEFVSEYKKMKEEHDKMQADHKANGTAN